MSFYANIVSPTFLYRNLPLHLTWPIILKLRPFIIKVAIIVEFSELFFFSFSKWIFLAYVSACRSNNINHSVKNIQLVKCVKHKTTTRETTKMPKIVDCLERIYGLCFLFLYSFSPFFLIGVVPFLSYMFFQSILVVFWTYFVLFAFRLSRLNSASKKEWSDLLARCQSQLFRPAFILHHVRIHYFV
jgi:hypothetical protein